MAYITKKKTLKYYLAPNNKVFQFLLTCARTAASVTAKLTTTPFELTIIRSYKLCVRILWVSWKLHTPKFTNVLDALRQWGNPINYLIVFLQHTGRRLNVLYLYLDQNAHVYS